MDSRKPRGEADGDLGGEYPSPTVTGLQGRPVASTAPAAGQVLKWNGTAWAPGTDASGSGGETPQESQYAIANNLSAFTDVAGFTLDSDAYHSVTLRMRVYRRTATQEISGRVYVECDWKPDAGEWAVEWHAYNDADLIEDITVTDAGQVQIKTHDLTGSDYEGFARVQEVVSLSAVSAGQIAINNNQSSFADLTGLLIDSNAYHGATISLRAYRRTDAGERVSRIVLEADYEPDSASWISEWRSFNDTNTIDDLTVDAAGQVQYKTDNMAGANYDGYIEYSIVYYGPGE